MQLNCDTRSLRGSLSYNQDLRRMNSWRTGGMSECFYIPADITDLSFFLEHCAGDHPITCLGMGSNVLVRDGGVPGIMLSLKGALDDIRRIGATEVCAEAGTACAKLARYCVTQGLAGLEFLAGVPGTVGGALAMNAGAFGHEIWQYVSKVDLVRRDGEVVTNSAAEFTSDYREVRMPLVKDEKPQQQWFVAGYFNLTAGDPEQLQRQIKQLLKKRNDTQPIGKANCGSVFRNPPNDHAARLIESCGLKGYAIGGACVSDKHANFINNQGNASASDIEALIRYVQDTVKQQTGIQLIPEVKIIGGTIC